MLRQKAGILSILGLISTLGLAIMLSIGVEVVYMAIPCLLSFVFFFLLIFIQYKTKEYLLSLVNVLACLYYAFLLTYFFILH